MLTGMWLGTGCQVTCDCLMFQWFCTYYRKRCKWARNCLVATGLCLSLVVLLFYSLLKKLRQQIFALTFCLCNPCIFPHRKHSGDPCLEDAKLAWHGLCGWHPTIRWHATGGPSRRRRARMNCVPPWRWDGRSVASPTSPLERSCNYDLWPVGVPCNYLLRYREGGWVCSLCSFLH
jgi:hypothetical protein